MPEEQAGGGWVLGRHYRVVKARWRPWWNDDGQKKKKREMNLKKKRERGKSKRKVAILGWVEPSLHNMPQDQSHHG